MARRVVTEAEWLKEMERLAAATRDRRDEGMTVAEMAESLGWDVSTVRRLLQKARDAGRLRLGWRHQEGLDGRMYRAPVYTLTPEPASASGRTGAKGGGS